jgi:hypothetical protein
LSAPLLERQSESRIDPSIQWERLDMKTILTCTILAFVFAGAASSADAKGCIKGAVAGGVAGHLAHHHGLAGAAVGCAIGHHEASKHAKEQTQQ